MGVIFGIFSVGWLYTIKNTYTIIKLFSVPPTQTSVASGQWVEYHPLSTIAGHVAIEFHVSGMDEDYLHI